MEPFNEANDALYQRYKTAQSLAKNKDYCAKLAAVARTFDKALLAITFPKDTAADAKALIRADSAAEADLITCAEASSFAELDRAWSLATKALDRGHEAANLVRLDLGLPPVPG